MPLFRHVSTGCRCVCLLSVSCRSFMCTLLMPVRVRRVRVQRTLFYLRSAEFTVTANAMVYVNQVTLQSVVGEPSHRLQLSIGVRGGNLGSISQSTADMYCESQLCFPWRCRTDLTFCCHEKWCSRHWCGGG